MFRIRKIVTVCIVAVALSIAPCAADTITFDITNYAVALRQLQSMVDQLKVMKQQLEYSYNQYQTIKEQMRTFSSGSYYDIMNSLNGISTTYGSLKDSWDSFSIEVGGDTIRIDELAKLPGEMAADYERIMRGEYSTSEQQAAYQMFGYTPSLQRLNADMGGVLSMFAKKAINNGTYNSDERGNDTNGSVKTAGEQADQLAQLAMGTTSTVQQNGVSATMTALLVKEIEELNRRVGDIGALAGASAENTQLTGQKIDVTDSAKAQRVYDFSDEFLSGDNY